MQFVMSSAEQAGWHSEQLHQEHFVAQKVDTSNNEAFTIEVKGTVRELKYYQSKPQQKH